jgi:hypothetical protein
VPGSNSGIDSVPRSMDNRSRRPVDFRYMASARKAPPGLCRNVRDRSANNVLYVRQCREGNC